MLNHISGGVTAAQGFRAGAVRCGIKASSQKDDTAVIVSDVPCTAAAVYTTNRVKAAPILVTREHLADHTARAVIVNSGNANACAPEGPENARREAAACAWARPVSLSGISQVPWKRRSAFQSVRPWRMKKMSIRTSAG